MTERQSEHEKSDADVDRALTDTLRTRPLDPQALARVREAVAHEWRATAAPNRSSVRSRRWLWVSLAAAVAVVTLTLGWFSRPAGVAVRFGSISRADSGDIDI